MKKFEEEFDKNVTSVALRQDGESVITVCDYNEAKAFGHGWVSPEDHQQVAKALVNTTDKLDCAEERVRLLEKTVDQLKSQLEKQQLEIPEVPPFVADWYEENKGSLEYNIWKYIRDWKEQEEDEFYKFINSNILSPIETIFAMKNGYTVKEKRFYLKNKLTGTYLYQNYGKFSQCDDSSYAWKNYKIKFTQQEIDSMETGSYEKIPVEENK